MSQKLYACLAILGLAAGSGCTMCQSPFDYAYSASGGSWQRADAVNGRVGSAFAPAGATVTGASWEEITTEPQGSPVQAPEDEDESVLRQPGEEPPAEDTDGSSNVVPLIDDSASTDAPRLLPANSAVIHEAGF